MSANNDYAVSRFLFAILQQKNLKDIDWNLVAHNPVLTQRITNGHAARMRYSRFKTSILGPDPKPRNRNADKSRVTKSKKEPKVRKEQDKEIKPEPNAPLAAPQQTPETEYHHQIKSETFVKTEPQAFRTEARPTSDVPTPMADPHMHYQNRLLTPCSDTDMFLNNHHGFATSPVSEYNHEQHFSFAGAAAQCASGHNQAGWQSSPTPFSPFINYDMEGYNGSPFGGHRQHQQTPRPENYGIAPSVMMAPNPSHAPVKHEEWDSQFNV